MSISWPLSRRCRRSEPPRRNRPRSLLIAVWATFALACPDRPLDDARAALEDGRLEEAGNAFLGAARSDPALLGAWDGAVEVWCRRIVNVARCLEVLDLELDQLGSIARHHDALATSLETRARARMSSGLTKSALADLKRAANAAPEKASIWVAEARAHAMLGDRVAALEALDKARRREPDNQEAREVLASLPAPETEDSEATEGFGGGDWAEPLRDERPAPRPSEPPPPARSAPRGNERSE